MMDLPMTVVDSIGNTPVLKLSGLFNQYDGLEVFAKLEFLNPSGSIKDRMVRYMLDDAQNRNLLSSKLVVESSSGNTGAALAMMAAVRRLKCEISVPRSISQEKIQRLEAYGATVHIFNSQSGASDYCDYGRMIALEKGGYYLDQYCSALNWQSHYSDTAPELWKQLHARLDYMVCGIGSGGKITGLARFLKEKSPSTLIVGVEPAGSIFTSIKAGTAQVQISDSIIEGVGKKEVPRSLDLSVVDEIIQVPDEVAVQFTRRLAREEGILAGGSSGCVVAAINILARRGVRGRVATIFPDLSEILCAGPEFVVR
jgi:cystathionine beta-synthase